MPAALWKNRRRSTPCLPPRASAMASKASLDLALPLILRIRIKLVAGDDLRRNGRVVLHQFGRHQRCKFFRERHGGHERALDSEGRRAARVSAQSWS